MRKTLFGLLAFGLLCGIIGAYAGSTIVIGSMAAVNNTTTNSAGVALSPTAQPNPGTVLISYLAYPGTNGFTVNLQWGVDNTNFPWTVASWQSPTNTGGTYSWQPSLTNVPLSIYERVQVVTTNYTTNSIIISQ